MNLVNIGLTELGADVIQFSSSLDSQLCQPNHVLMDKSDVIRKRCSIYGTADKEYLNI
jgi:hypothetical protein